MRINDLSERAKGYRTLIKFVVTSLLLWYIFKFIDIAYFLSVVSNANLYLLSWSFLLAIFNQLFISNLKWSIILREYGTFIPFNKLCNMYLTGMFFSMFLPGSYGGDFVRAYQVSTHTEKAMEGVMSVVLERVAGAVGLLVILLFALLFLDQPFISLNFRVWVIGLIMTFFLAIPVLFSKKVFRSLEPLLARVGKKNETLVRGIYESISVIKSRKVILSTVFLSIIFQFLVVLTNYLIAISLNVNIDFTYFLLAIPIASLISMIPITLNGIGVRDMSYIALFGAAGVSKEAAFSIGLIAFLMGIALSVYGGFVYIRQK